MKPSDIKMNVIEIRPQESYDNDPNTSCDMPTSDISDGNNDKGFLEEAGDSIDSHNMGNPDEQSAIIVIQPKEPEKLHQCPYASCGHQVFKTKEERLQHITLHEETKQRQSTYRCINCGEIFMTKQSLSQHTIKHEKAEQMHHCLFPNCGKVFKNRKTLGNHSILHTPPRFKCDKCAYYGHWKHLFMLHLKKIHPTEPYKQGQHGVTDPYSAGDFNFPNNSAKTLNNQQSLINVVDRVAHKDCESFIDESHQSHPADDDKHDKMDVFIKEAKHDDKNASKTIKDDIIMKNTGYPQAVPAMGYIQDIPQEKFKPTGIQPTIPQIEEDSQSSLSEHDWRLYSCGICKGNGLTYKWNNVVSLINHVKSHPPSAVINHNQPYACAICSKKFKLAKFLEIHINESHHIHSDAELWTRFVIDEKDLVKSEEDTPADKTDDEGDEIQCGRCLYRDTDLQKVKQHVETAHCFDRAYKCGRCSFTCEAASQLQAHINSKRLWAAKNWYYHCFQCQIKFSCVELLTKHVEMHGDH